MSSIHIDYEKLAAAPETNLDDTYRSRLWLDGDVEPLAQGEENEVFQDGDQVKITLHHFAPTAFDTEEGTQSYQPRGALHSRTGRDRGHRLGCQSTLARILGRPSEHAARSARQRRRRKDYIDDLDELLAYTAARYWYDFNRSNQTIAGLTGTVGGQQWVGSGVVTAKPDLLTGADGDYLFDHLNYSIAPVDMGVDLPNITHVFFDHDTTTSDWFDHEAYQLMGYNSSALEHAVVEEVINSKSISTMKGLQGPIKPMPDSTRRTIQSRMTGSTFSVDRPPGRSYGRRTGTAATPILIWMS